MYYLVQNLTPNESNTNVKPVTLKLLEENIVGALHDKGV